MGVEEVTKEPLERFPHIRARSLLGRDRCGGSAIEKAKGEAKKNGRRRGRGTVYIYILYILCGMKRRVFMLSVRHRVREPEIILKADEEEEDDDDGELQRDDEQEKEEEEEAEIDDEVG